MRKALEKGDFREYIEWVEKHAEHKRLAQNERATEWALVGPLLTLLGWNLTDPEQCIARYRFDEDANKQDHDAANKQDPTLEVDFALLHERQPSILVEVKRAGEKRIAKHRGQLGRYFAKARGQVELGILTNGKVWLFFTYSQAEHVMDEEPFVRWNVTNQRPPIDLLSILQKSSYDPSQVRAFLDRRRRADEERRAEVERQRRQRLLEEERREQQRRLVEEADRAAAEEQQWRTYCDELDAEEKEWAAKFCKWVAAQCDIGEEYNESQPDLAKSYQQFCQGPCRETDREFFMRLDAKGFPRYQSNGDRRRGLRLKSIAS